MNDTQNTVSVAMIRAAQALKYYQSTLNVVPVAPVERNKILAGHLDAVDECYFVDLVADLLHLAKFSGLDPYEVLETAGGHYEEESEALKR